MIHAQERLLDPLVNAVQHQTRLARAHIRACFREWDALPLVVGGEHIGSWAVRGPEIHFALAEGKRPRGSVRGAVRAALAPLFEKHGYLTTRLPIGFTDEDRFVQRIGFRPTWRDENFQYYLLGTLPFARKP